MARIHSGMAIVLRILLIAVLAFERLNNLPVALFLPEICFRSYSGAVLVTAAVFCQMQLCSPIWRLIHILLIAFVLANTLSPWTMAGAYSAGMDSLAKSYQNKDSYNSGDKAALDKVLAPTTFRAESHHETSTDPIIFGPMLVPETTAKILPNESVTTDRHIARVSVSSNGTQANGPSFSYSSSSVSANGRYVVFESDASNLVAGDTNGVSDIFVHDRQTGQTTRVSVAC
jgi:hypothetical protein